MIWQMCWFRIKALPLLHTLAMLATPVSAQSENGRQNIETIVTFGTSLTARGGWQKPLADRLSSCLGHAVSVEVIAQSGAPSSWGLAHVGDVVGLKPDVVLIEFYANDAALNRLTTIQSSADTMGATLAQLRNGLPDARIIMQIMNPISGVGGLIRPFLTSYIDAHIQQASLYGAEIIDYTSRWASLSPGELASAIPDGLHPTAEAATRMIVPPLAEKIGGTRCAVLQQ